MLEPQLPDDQLPIRRWSIADLIIFASFFGLTIIFLPLAALHVLRLFRPGLTHSELTTVDQIVLQGVMDFVLVGFIVFLVKIVHHKNFRETIHWYPHQFHYGSLISLGATLAVAVLLTSALFPSPQETPIEKLISSTRSLYVFALFGTIVAPLFEELIFRGFLFAVFTDMSGRSVAVTMTSVLFALLHAVQLWGNWAAVALIFIVGYVLALIRDRSGSLVPSVVVHMSYNGMLFALYAISTMVQKGVRPN